MTIPQAQIRRHRGQVFSIKLTADQVIDFHKIGAQVMSQWTRTRQKTVAPLLGLSKSLYYFCLLFSIMAVLFEMYREVDVLRLNVLY